MLVQVKGKGVKLAGKWCFIGDKAEIDEVEYEKYKEYVDVIDEEKSEKLKTPQIPSKNDMDDDDVKLLELRAKAKELSIRNYHIMGIEKLEAAIKEKEAPLFEVSNNRNNNENNEEENPVDNEHT